MKNILLDHSDTLNMIGDISIERVLETALTLANRGGATVPAHPITMSDFPVSGPALIRTTSEAHAQTTGTILMSSGGTTGTPKLTFVPYEQSISRITQSWQPLTSGNVMLNLYNPGRLWGSHYYMLALAQKVNCRMVPMGALLPDEVETYMPVLEAGKVDTLAGTPTAVHDFAMGLRQCNGTLPVKKIMWVGEPWSAKKKDDVQGIFPDVEFWGNYGSIETYVIASNTPDCTYEIFHLHPDQILELDSDGALLTRVGDGWTVPTLRYRLGDTLVKASCPCGRPDAFRVRGRSDSSFKFGGTLCNSIDMLSFLSTQSGIDEVQLQISGNKNQAIASDVTVKYAGTADAQTVLSQLIAAFVDIDVRDAQGELKLKVEPVDALDRNPRTHKILATNCTK